VEAQLDGDKQRNRHMYIYGSLTTLFYNHQDILTIEHISRALEQAVKRLEDRNR